MDTEDKIKELGPWRHNIEINGISTYDVANTTGVFSQLDHPNELYEIISEFVPEDTETLLDLGCGAGGFCFLFEDEGIEVTGVDPSLEGKVEDPMEQALFCKEQLGSDVEFVEQTAEEYIKDGVEQDVVLFLGVIHLIAKNDEEKGEERREQFMLDLIQSGAKRVIVEHSSSHWFKDNITEDIGELVYIDDTPFLNNANRALIVIDPAE